METKTFHKQRCLMSLSAAEGVAVNVAAQNKFHYAMKGCQA